MGEAGVIQEEGRTFWKGSEGRWAAERMMKALAEGRMLTAAELRTADTLRKDEWIHLDTALIEEGTIRLRAVADLMAMGLVVNVPNGLGKTIFQYEKITDMNPAQTTLDGISRSDDDRQEFSLENLPLPITHKDFSLNLRTLLASRSRGEALDTTQIRTCGRLISEKVEADLFNGGKTFAGVPIYGCTTHPNRNQVSYITNGNWAQAAKTGENIVADVLKMIQAAEGDRFYGPYYIYIPSDASTKLSEDFKANSDKTIRQRLLEIDRIKGVEVADQLAAGSVVMYQTTRDVVCIVQGEPLQTVQWDIEGGFRINFKAFTIMVPLIRADSQGRCGVVHMT